jgi:hypothetical protein
MIKKVSTQVQNQIYQTTAIPWAPIDVQQKYRAPPSKEVDPTKIPDPKNRMAFCNDCIKAVNQLKLQHRPHDQQQPYLRALARQFAHLDTDRPIQDMLGVSIMLGGHAWYPLEPDQQALFNAKKKNNLPLTKREMAHVRASPQKRIFDTVLTNIAPRHARNVTYQQSQLLGILVGRGKQITEEPLAPNDQEIARRIAFAPVWAEMLTHANRLKPERQDKLLSQFKQSFDNMAGDAPKRERMVQSYGDGFVALASALPDLKEPKHTDSTSTRQETAMDLLKTLSPDMSREQKLALAGRLMEARGRMPAMHPLYHEIVRFATDLRK